jgi:nicotinate dehydrogenase subunit A
MTIFEMETNAAMVKLCVNGEERELPLPSSAPLLSILRNDFCLNGPKYGCGLGECGACSVLVDGIAARACILTAANVEGRHIVTLEGLGTADRPHPVQAAFIAAAGAQCGYCLNGMIVTAAALLDANPAPTDEEIKEALRYNLCRCGAHVEILAAVKLAASWRPR